MSWPRGTERRAAQWRRRKGSIWCGSIIEAFLTSFRLFHTSPRLRPLAGRGRSRSDRVRGLSRVQKLVERAPHPDPLPAQSRRGGAHRRQCGSGEITIEDTAIDFRQLLQIGHRRALVDLVMVWPQGELDDRAVAEMKRASEVPPDAQFRPPAGDFLDRFHREVGEGAGLGHEDVGIGGLPHDPGADAISRRRGQPLLDQGPERFLGMEIVEADVEFRPRLGRDHIVGGVADIHRC